MTKKAIEKAIDELILEGTHSTDAQEELVWNEVRAHFGDEYAIQDIIDAMERIQAAALDAMCKLRKLK